MSMLILVWGIDSDKHMMSEYVIVFIHLVSIIDTNQQKIEVMIIWEIYLVNDLKTKMLININIIRSEQIDIITSKRQVTIDTCQNVIILIELCSQSSSIKCIIHIKFNIIISSHTEQPISIHHVRHLSEQNFLFKFKESSNLVLFAYMIDSIMSVIIT